MKGENHNSEEIHQPGLDFELPQQEDIEVPVIDKTTEKTTSAEFETDHEVVNIQAVSDAARRLRGGNIEKPVGKIFFKMFAEELHCGYYIEATAKHLSIVNDLKEGQIVEAVLPKAEEDKALILFYGSFNSDGTRDYS